MKNKKFKREWSNVNIQTQKRTNSWSCETSYSSTPQMFVCDEMKKKTTATRFSSS